MEDWVARALKRWPNVPALYGWLTLTRRGQWLIKGESISRAQIIDVINNNYASDEFGRWYFQNGPQRGYMKLEYAPLVLHTWNRGENWRTHNQLDVSVVKAAYVDEQGAIILSTEHGPGIVKDDDLEWLLPRLRVHDASMSESQLAEALSLASGAITNIQLLICRHTLPLIRLDAALAPQQLKFIRDPQPLNAEPAAECKPNEPPK